MSYDTAVNVCASLIIGAALAGAMALFGAPTWAWVGIGWLAYLLVLPRR